MKKNIFVVDNLIWISIEQEETYCTNAYNKYVLCGRTGGVLLNAILTTEELVTKYPNGKFLKGINPSDTITFTDK